MQSYNEEITKNFIQQVMGNCGKLTLVINDSDEDKELSKEFNKIAKGSGRQEDFDVVNIKELEERRG